MEEEDSRRPTPRPVRMVVDFCRGILTQNPENMEVRPVVALARSTGSAFDHERLSLFHGFEATLAIAGDPECGRFPQNPWRLVALGGWFVLFPSPLSGAWPSPSSLPTAYAVGCILSPLPGWFLPHRRLQIRGVSFMANLGHASDHGRRLRIDNFF